MKSNKKYQHIKEVILIATILLPILCVCLGFGCLGNQSVTNNTMYHNFYSALKLVAIIVGIVEGSSICIDIVQNNINTNINNKRIKRTKNDVNIIKPFKNIMAENMKCINSNNKKYMVEYYCYITIEAINNEIINKETVLNELNNIKFKDYLKKNTKNLLPSAKKLLHMIKYEEHKEHN